MSEAFRRLQLYQKPSTEPETGEEDMEFERELKRLCMDMKKIK